MLEVGSNSQKLGSSSTQANIFDRLYNEKDSKKLKRDTLQEEQQVKQKYAKSRQCSRSKSNNKSNKSMTPDRFYEKQMKLKIDADKKLMQKVFERSRKYETHIQNSKQTSKTRSRKRSDVNSDNPSENVHERLFNDVKERSRKRMGIEMENSNKNFESLANFSLSDEPKNDFSKKYNLKRKKRREDMIYGQNKSLKKIIAPLRSTNSKDVSVALFKDAQVRREKQKTQRKKSRSKERDEINKTK